MADASRSRPGAGYWYDGQPEVQEMLEAVRRFRAADQAMRRSMASGMDMNVSDMEALRFAIEAERHGDPLTPSRLSENLGISTASTTKLIDRLTASGRLARRAHPSDRRSIVLIATEQAHAEVRARLARMHRAMAAAALAVDPAARPAVIAFLDALVAIHQDAAEVTAPEPPAPPGPPGW